MIILSTKYFNVLKISFFRNMKFYRMFYACALSNEIVQRFICRYICYILDNRVSASIAWNPKIIYMKYFINVVNLYRTKFCDGHNILVFQIK